MSKVVIKINDISKQYRLGLVGTGTLSHDLNRWWNLARGKEDPYLKIGETNDRSKAGDSQYAWALRDINLEVKQGEVLGIIGKNGAGKSTLLKILSRVTGPTTGSIKVKGRIGSLLEVGTGFHPELTGRENIFLNGAILGMTKLEIKDRLDEIIDFSGTERYVDTPVKRYSSGMKVRLAFSVAAHLEPEILVIDEVLAVGDIKFQRKALSKMEQISEGEGRTILFVSHNMTAIESLCSKVLIIEDGKNGFLGNTEAGIREYLKEGIIKDQIIGNELRRGNHQLTLISILFTYKKGKNEVISNNIPSGNDFHIRLKIKNSIGYSIRTNIALLIRDHMGRKVTCFDNLIDDDYFTINNEIVDVLCIVENMMLTPGRYNMQFWMVDDQKRLLDYFENSFFEFNIVEANIFGTGKIYKNEKHGPAMFRTKWKLIE